VYSIHPLVKARRPCICAGSISGNGELGFMINGDGELVAGTTHPMPRPMLMSLINTYQAYNQLCMSPCLWLSILEAVHTGRSLFFSSKRNILV